MFKVISNMTRPRCISCMLKSLDSTKTILLPNNKTVCIGRNEETCIMDTLVSRKQITATADYSNYSLLIETHGTNYSGCNGYALRKNAVYHLNHQDILELLISRHKFEVVFDPPPSEIELTASVSGMQNGNKAEETNTGQNASLWEKIDNGELLVYTTEKVKPQTRIVSFDLDGTLIRTRSGARFAKDAQDWVLNFPNIRQKLIQLFLDDFKIVIFSNQAGLAFDQSKITEFKAKVEAILKEIDVPMQVFIATTKSMYRKPLPGMWNTLCNEKNGGIDVDVTKSIYVGDAAGRAKNWAPKKNKDHSVSDRLFAMNLNLKFYTPEEYFLNARSVRFEMPKFDPRNVVIKQLPSYNSSSRDVVLMVGCPASGKSYFCKNHLTTKNYSYVNRDSLGSQQQCIKLLERSLRSNQNVVVDNTNPDKATRKQYIDICKTHNYPIRCFLMTTTLEHCKHNNKFRSLTDKSHALVGDVILYSYQKRFQEPTIDEGFSEIVKVDFVPEFNDAEHAKLYKMFLLES